MSISSTQHAMGYVGHTESADNCSACARAVKAVWPRPAGRRCTQGGFYVAPTGTCRKFIRDPHASDQRVQIGPTDI